MSELHKAVVAGNVDLIEKLIEDGAFVREPGGSDFMTNKTPLALAVMIESPRVQREITQALVDAGACDHGYTSMNWASPFEEATRLNKEVFLDVVKDTPAYEAYVEHTQQKRSRDLWKASRAGSLERVENCLLEGADPNREVEIRIGRRRVSMKPIEGARTAEVFDALMEAGSEIPTAPKAQVSMIDWAASDGNVPVLEKLHEQGMTKHLSNGKPWANEPLATALVNGNDDAVKWLLDHGADPNGKFKNGKLLIPVMDSFVGQRSMTFERKKELAEILVDAGAKPSLSKDISWRYVDEEEVDKLDSHLKRYALGNVAQSNRPSQEEDLATPEQALAARQARYGRAM